MKPILFLDFDRTLFDLNRFMVEFLGVRHEDHIQNIHSLSHLHKEHLPDLSTFYYEDTAQFLSDARKKGYNLVLMTQAVTNPAFQSAKVLASRVENYMDEVVITGSDKVTPIRERILHLPKHVKEESAFIDDRHMHVVSVKAALPELTVLLMDRRGVALHAPIPVDDVIYDFGGFWKYDSARKNRV